MSHYLSVPELAFWQAHGFGFDLLDVRRAPARALDATQIAQAIWRDPAAWLDWKDDWLAASRPVVIYCAHGHEISQGMTAALRAMGIDARYLVGGIVQWKADHAVVPLGPLQRHGAAGTTGC